MRIGFDVGGTFTDVILLEKNGQVTTAKMLSLLDRIGDDIAAFVREAVPNAEVESFVHGTTSASNAVIEGKTARTGLITTKGFRDELEMRGQRRPNVYDIDWERIPPLIPRALRLEVDERVLADGRIETPLDAGEAERAVKKLVADAVEAIAICFINSYLNPANEKRMGELVARVAPGLVYCLSSDIHPEIREYERMSTTAINASLIPVFDRYMGKLERRLSAFSDRFLMMQSNGGIMTAKAARRFPAHLIESGPAAGVLAAARLARETGLDQVLSFDMGGTTAKACLIERGIPLEKPGGEVGGGATQTSRLSSGGGHALRVPWLDIVEVGAGGGSIAWIDEGGALRVGPESAGAEPGPVCYGRGGKRPTVTDANVVLGYINPENIANATLKIDRAAAWTAIEKTLAVPLGLTVHEAAHGITRVANATMMRALRSVSTERGRDPREFSLISFGGAGSLHAAEMARNLGIRRVIVPIFPGLFSALGLLLADYRHDYVRSITTTLQAVEPARIMAGYEAMEQQARAELKDEGIASGIRFERQIDLKYDYQLSELTMPFPAGIAAGALHATLAANFTRMHEQEFGYSGNDKIELVNLRLRATAAAGDLKFAELASQLRAPAAARKARTREAYFGAEHGVLTVPVLSRMEIAGEQKGALIIEEPDTTIVVPPGWSVSRDGFASLILTQER